MRTSKIKSGNYSISIGDKALTDLSSYLTKHKYLSFYILCDENTLQSCLPTLIRACPKLTNAEILEIESGEQSKSLEFSSHIWQTLIENKADKNSLVINLGGGVVSDLGGFTASVYKRGIHFIHVPTSLLAMADASVGGKTGVDFNSIKNAIGTFSDPKAVFIYPPFLNTLPERHFQNGIVEIYKIALVADKELWKLINNEKCSIHDLILKSVTLKNNIVSQDPLDKGIRKILNFGHTIGHAVESLFIGSLDELLHGEAILIGMLMESHLAYQKKLISKKTLTEITNQFAESFFFPLLDDSLFSPMMELLKNDKKNKGDKLQFSLVSGIGRCNFDVEVVPSQIKKAFRFYNSLNQ